MSNMGEYQTKESSGRIIWDYYETISPEKHDSSREERMSSLSEGEWDVASPKEGWCRMKWKLYAKMQRPEKWASSLKEGFGSLPEGERAVAEFQRGKTQDKVKVCTPRCNVLKKDHLPERKGSSLYRRVSEVLLSSKEEGGGWSENRMPRCNTLKNGHLPVWKGWALCRRVSELLLSPKVGWHRMKSKLYAKVQHPEKQASSWVEGLNSLPEGEWAFSESQRGMTQDQVKFACHGANALKNEHLLFTYYLLFILLFP